MRAYTASRSKQYRRTVPLKQLSTTSKTFHYYGTGV